LQKFVDAAQAASLVEHGRRVALKEAVRRYARHCADYKEPSVQKAMMQIGTTIVPLILLVAAMTWLAEVSWPLMLLLAFPLGGLLVRCFIIQHDCGHGSFLPTRQANDLVGRLMSLLTFTPYALWRRVHAQHHATSGNLDRRGIGDIKTLTVEEYRSLGTLGKLRYRIYRHPAFLFLLGVPAFFVLVQRLPWGHPLTAKDCWRSVIGLDAAIVVVYGALAMLIGLKILIMIALPSLIVASAIGGWLFFIQHQFEETNWEQKEEWDFQVAAVHGSSFYDLPPVLRWFTGNIGLHHIHHLNSTVPNYRLTECMAAMPELAEINRLTLRESLKCARLTLWDPEARRLIRFSEAALLARV
jgi:omega-6 fatty acid desaturase (delta-12 desaturase)